MNKNKKVIFLLLIIILLTTFWGIKDIQNEKTFKVYRSDLGTIKSSLNEIKKSLDYFTDSPTIENYSQIQYKFGFIGPELNSLHRSMRECYRKGLIDIPYEHSETNSVLIVGSLIKDSSNLIAESITINNNQIELDEYKIEVVNENFNLINDLLKPYYDGLD